MKPIQLSMQAFGPYVEKQVIPFEALAKHSLFLIQGETGSGKTAILDAITYALYGKSSGGQREEFESMRCRFAPDDIETYVELIFSLRDHQYRFYRSIELRKKRDDTLIPRLIINAGSFDNGEFIPFFENPKLRNIEEKAIELIGLTHEQFVQVIMLPQGKFEQLLVSKSEEKQEILKTLFQSDRWGNICDQLSELMKQKKDEIDSLQQKLNMLFQNTELKTVEEVQESLKALKQKQKLFEDQNHEEDVNQQKLQQLIQQQKFLHKQDQALEKITKEYNEVNEQQEQMQVLKQQVDKQQQYAVWKPYYDSCELLQQELNQRYFSYQKVQNDLKSLKQKVELHPELLNQLSNEKEKYDILKQQLISFNNKTEVYQHLYDAIDKADQAASQSKRIEKNVNEIQQKLADHELKLKQVEEFLNEAKKQELLCKEYDIELLKLNQAREVKQQLEVTKAELQQIETDQKTLLTQKKDFIMAYEKNKLQHEQYYEQYLSHSAYQLAELLQENQPCPVCGSLHHPNPAVIKKQYADLQNLQQMKQQVDESRKRLDTCTMQIHNHENKIVLLQQQCEEQQKQYETFVFDEQRYQYIQNSIIESRNILKLVQNKNELYEQLHKKETEYITEYDIQKKVLQDKNQELIRWNTIVEESRKQLDDAIMSMDELHCKIDLLQVQISEISQSIDHKQEQIKKEENLYVSLKQEQNMFEQEIQLAEKRLSDAKQKFKNLTSFDFADCDPAWFIIDEQGMKDQIDQFQEYERHKQDLLFQKLQLESELNGKKLLDLKQLEVSYEQKRIQYHKRLQEYAQLSAMIQQRRQDVKLILKLQEKLDMLQPEYLKQNQFVRALRGDNSIGIERYVLGIMLSNITQVANRLLKKVHDGRYQIYRSDDASGRTRKFGLELCIYDSYSCSKRSVTSLSGGEKFLVSLSLSLALSTVVQSRSSAMHIDALFIDEGFGSLDERSIADALQVLSSMVSDKSMIGIISHVDMLKENIPYGIEVSKDRFGSNLIVKVL